MQDKQERQERLQQFFRSNPEIWDDVEDEFRDIIKSQDQILKNKTCENREWQAGYCIGLEEIFYLKGRSQRWKKPE